MIPLMSKDKALHLIQNDHMSCPMRSFDYFHNNSEIDMSSLPLSKKILLLQGHFGAGKSGVMKNQAKLSKHVFNLMCSEDPDAFVSDI